ncbi:low specificity L-threonine aldolase [Celeribacter ethanolicus]|uniref:Low specificity L-threonine aldolase n=1 Tax=Celeribacter ethanolicus TaxID=1758178 RepID=A0A291GBF3_9RHOB|nr:beta-eliminating lyase-related protein [Celeribacter ethanolicus]ATG47729.1 low specificity L-threonine aldolase [Celeribacter ethanolicus]
MFFGSDNTSGVHPKLMEALTKANDGYAAPYANDLWTAELTERLRDMFQAPDALVYPMTSGTGTNAALLAAMTPPWGIIYCHKTAHIEVDERNSVPFYSGGAKLKLMTGEGSRMTPEELRQAVINDSSKDDVHASPPAAVSLTNLTEFGEFYRPADIAALAEASRLPLHFDGARFANAMAASGATPWEMTRELATLSLGATKTGAMGAEAAVLFDPSYKEAFESQRMRGGHNLSKARYVSAQMLAWLEDDLWLELATQANAMGARLAQGISEIGGELAYKVEGNLVFARLPRKMHVKAKAKGAVYNMWGPGTALTGDPNAPLLARFVASWSTTEADVDALLAALSD